MTTRHVPRTRPVRTIRLIAALVTATACGPKADPVVPPPTPTLGVTVAPATLTLAPRRLGRIAGDVRAVRVVLDG